MVILYHAGCADGAVAAWVAQHRYPNAELVPVAYQRPPPDVSGRHVLIVDFSYPRETLLAMHAKAASLRVLDHHKTAAEDLQGLDFCVFDMSRSGAGITWDVLFDGAPRPWLVDYTEDRDIWRWRLPDSKMVNAYLQTVGHDMAALSRVVADGLDVARDRGRVAEAVRRDYINATKRTAYRAFFAGEDGVALCVNAGGWANSEVLGELATESEAGYAFAWAECSDGTYAYSLRSRAGVDVSAIAKRFGGGGHAQAAGFSTPDRVHVRAGG